jgi:hypothetical protein
MGTGLTEMLGSGAILIIAALWLAVIAGALILPFALLSVASSLRGIRRELERANGGAVPARGGLFPNATVRASEPEPGSLGHQLLR